MEQRIGCTGNQQERGFLMNVQSTIIKKAEIVFEGQEAKRQKQKRLSFDPVLSDDKWWKRKTDLICEYLLPKSGDTILDFGSASCEPTEFLANKGCKMVALDISKAMLLLSKERNRRLSRSLEIEYVVADGENLPFCNDAFDKIMSWGSLHHITSVKKAINEINRVLKKNGLLAISEPNAFNIFRRIQEQKWSILESSFYPWKIKRLLRDAKFKIVKHTYIVDTSESLGPPWLRTSEKKRKFWEHYTGDEMLIRKLVTKAWHHIKGKLGKPFNYFLGSHAIKCQKFGYVTTPETKSIF